MNGLLAKFGAALRVAGTTKQFAGGKPSSTYQLVVNDVPVELGDATPLEVASFKNTLSAGDWSTLALAFFLIRLVKDSGLTEKSGHLRRPV